MGKASTIEWTDHTFNGWIGCQHATVAGDVDEMCRNCYAEVGTMARVKRSRGLPLWGENAHRHRTSVAYWKQPLTWNRAAHVAGVRARVFSNSLSDVFEDRRDLDPMRADLFELIERTPHLDWLLLSKRPENMNRLVPETWRSGWPNNAWAGTSTGTQAAADLRIGELLQVPARVRFLSMEPLLAPVFLRQLWYQGKKIDALKSMDMRRLGGPSNRIASIDWVIVGGESGPHARPCDLGAVRTIVADCKAAGVPVFVKQLGAVPIPQKPPTGPNDMTGRRVFMWQSATTLEQRLALRLVDKKGGGNPAEWPEDLSVREFPAGGAR